MSEAAPRVRDRGLLARWGFVMRTCNPPPGRVDGVSKWLVLVRACVLPMTLTSALVGGLLAWWREPSVHVGWLALSAVGLLLAHGANNLMNDLFDLDTGTDTDSYPRALYAPHPVGSGMISRGGLIRASIAVNLLSLGVLVALTWARGWPILAFALAGFFISAGYTAPPIRLKQRGLGEPGVLVVWGPLMVGGTYYAATGTVSWEVVWASIPYGLLATAVLMGKHIDKIPWDEGRVGTLPALLGERASRIVTLGMMLAFYPIVGGLVSVRILPLPSLVVLLAAPVLLRVWRAYTRPRPTERPKDYPVWPLWYAPAAFVHTRRAGALFVVGLLAGALLG